MPLSNHFVRVVSSVQDCVDVALLGFGLLPGDRMP